MDVCGVCVCVCVGVGGGGGGELVVCAKTKKKTVTDHNTAMVYIACHVFEQKLEHTN